MVQALPWGCSQTGGTVHCPRILSVGDGPQTSMHLCGLATEERERGTGFHVFKITKLERRLSLCKLVFTPEKSNNQETWLLNLVLI